jgi:hypothetical protein
MVQKLPGKVENDLGIAGGQNALPAVLHLGRPCIPKHPYKEIEGRGRGVLEVKQGSLEVLIAWPRIPAKPIDRAKPQ